MAGADEFGHVTAVLAELASDVDIFSIEMRRGDGGRRIVCVHTPTPGRLVGRRGATAEAVRGALVERLGDAAVQLNILESRPE